MIEYIHPNNDTGQKIKKINIVTLSRKRSTQQCQQRKYYRYYEDHERPDTGEINGICTELSIN